MRVSRADLAVAATLLWFAAPALAQLGPPVPLAPPPVRQAPAPPPPAAVPAAPVVSTSGDDINATPLAPMDASWVGTLGAADNALPHAMWAATPRSVVAAALPLLQATTSPALQDLARRLLLTDAMAPAGQDAAGKPGLAELRLNRLLALGRIDGVKLIDTLPQLNTGEAFDRDTVELRIAANDSSRACQVIRDRVARYRNSWWDRALVACQALSGAYDQAALGLNIMRDQPPTARDPVFEALVENILGHRQAVDKLPDPTPMRVALLAAAKLPLPADTMAAAGPAALAVWATSDKVPAMQRLGAAEKAMAFAALPPDALGLLYASIEATPQEQTTILKNGKPPEDPRSRAILYDIARTSAGAARAATLAPLFADARRRGAFVTTARLVAPLIAELQPAPDMQGFAGDAARALLAARDIDHALPWIDLANSVELRVIAALAQSGHVEGADVQLSAAAAALIARDANAAPRQIDLLAALSSALGEKLGEVDLAPLLLPNHQALMPGGALWLDQQQAASSGRVGETVLTSLLIAAAGDHLTPEPVLLARVVAGLKAVGLEADARALAVEAALSAGI